MSLIREIEQAVANGEPRMSATNAMASPARTPMILEGSRKTQVRRPIHVLFVCTGNSARSIVSEAVLNAMGEGRFKAYSAGSRPTGQVNPLALAVLEQHQIPAGDLSSKSWHGFESTGAPALDIVVTVCDNAALEPCPVLLGDFVRTHWGLPDPAAVGGSAAFRLAAFERAFQTIHTRIMALMALPLESLPREQWLVHLEAIGQFGIAA
jgi:protein-tyrosine-phosphatase